MIRSVKISPTAWRVLVVAVPLIALWVGVRLAVGPIDSGDPIGLVFGGLATAWLVFAALYGARRRAMARVSRWRLGNARRWLLWHLQAGTLFLVTMMLHAGPGWPAGWLSWALWLLSIWTVATGCLGLALQRTIPRVLTARSGLEVLYERIPELVDDLRHKAEALVSNDPSSLRVFYESRLAPALAAPRRDPLVLLGGSPSTRPLEPLEHLRALLPDEEKERLEGLESLMQAKVDLDVHYTLQQALRSWLWLHVPPSVLLLVLVILHIATVLYY